MAKIKFSKSAGKVIKGKKKEETIAGKAYIEDYKKRFQLAYKISKEQHKTNVLAKEIYIGSIKQKDTDDTMDN